MFYPRLADLFEALVIGRASAHAIEILRNDRMIIAWQRKPIHWLVTVVARVCPYCQANLSTLRGIKLCHVFDISDNNVRADHKAWHSGADCMLHRWHEH